MAHDTERLGDLLDSLVPVLVERLHETGLGEIEIERDGATVRVRYRHGGTKARVQRCACAPKILVLSLRRSPHRPLRVGECPPPLPRQPPAMSAAIRCALPPLAL